VLGFAGQPSYAIAAVFANGSWRGLKMTACEGFADRLKYALAASGITKVELGEMLGTAPARVSEWTSGRTTPSMGFLCMLPDILDIDGHWLLTGNGNMETVSRKREGYEQLVLGIARSCEKLLRLNEASDVVERIEDLMDKRKNAG
jgi:transcriptional regulator with XRE-family HTH domain